MMGLPNIYEALVVSILSALGVSTLLLLFTWQLGRRLHVFRELSLTFVVASLVLGLATYTFLAPGETPQTDRFLLFLLYLLAAVTILGVAGLYLFRVYLISNRGLLLPPILHRFAMAAVYLIAIDQRQIEFPQRRLEIPTQGLKKKSCSRPLRRPFPRSSFL